MVQLVVYFTLFQRYLKEIGYTDTIIDVRSARVRSLLGLQPQHENEGEGAQPALVNGESSNKRAIDQAKARLVIVLDLNNSLCT